ncbi:MAG: GTPase Era [Candidatus Kapabacteria bacterium]|nr:GTPase Era [Candidatus Kapabacteria bacterium]
MTRFGYIAIVGKPNAGKSTLLNAILGERLSIVTPKPETTRRSVLGIYSTLTAQMVFLDTPGIVPRPKFELHRQMIGYIHQAIEEANVVIVLVDVTDPLKSILQMLDDPTILEVRKSGKPVILVINKMDRLEEKAAALPIITKLLESGIFKDNIAISAKNNKFIGDLLRLIESHLPEGEFMHDAEMLSTQPQLFFVSEFIREQVFALFRDEIPYSTEVKVIKYSEREKRKWMISAEIIVDRMSQKGILIGAKGQSLREVGSQARARIEEHLGVEVFLELFVKVREEWRDNERELRDLGYQI